MTCSICTGGGILFRPTPFRIDELQAPLENHSGHRAKLPPMKSRINGLNAVESTEGSNRDRGVGILLPRLKVGFLEQAEGTAHIRQRSRDGRKPWSEPVHTAAHFSG